MAKNDRSFSKNIAIIDRNIVMFFDLSDVLTSQGLKYVFSHEDESCF
jgi:hypothetical protein